MKHYILGKDNVPVVCDSLNQWAEWFETDERILAQTEIGGAMVSTVFLGLDHSFSDDPDADPLLFETMIFGGPRAEEQWRYKDYNSAMANHNILVAQLTDVG